MTKKKLIKWATFFVATLFFIVYIVTILQRGTVIEQIYLAAQNEQLHDFNIVPEIKNLSTDDLLAADTFGGLLVYYEKNNLPKNISVSLFFPSEDSSLLEIEGAVHLSNTETINIIMVYNTTEKTMTYKPIIISTPFTEQGNIMRYKDSTNISRILTEHNVTTDDITEYQNYILYDVVVKTWADAHNEDFEKEREKVERLTKIDDTFSFPE